MNLNELKKPIEVWIPEDFILPGIRPIPLLMHTTPPDTAPELLFWNLLREKLEGLIEVRPFKNLEEAGPLVAIPHLFWEYRLRKQWNSVNQYNRKVLASGRTLVVFPTGIEYEPRTREIAFSTSAYRTKIEKSILTPQWLFDIGTQVTPISKPSMPTVGFVGDTQYPGLVSSLVRSLPLSKQVRYWMASSQLVGHNSPFKMRRAIAGMLRRQVIKEVRNASNLKTSIIERKGGFFNFPEEQRKRFRAEYIASIQNNAYSLCMRGDDNGCYQIYEVMSAGRIPIIIDTNIRLPDLSGFGNKWEDLAPIVPCSELHRIGEIVQAFHDRMSAEDFTEACKKSRAAFEYLLPHNFLVRNLSLIAKASHEC